MVSSGSPEAQQPALQSGASGAARNGAYSRCSPSAARRSPSPGIRPPGALRGSSVPCARLPPPRLPAKGGPAPAAAKFSPKPEADVHATENALPLGLLPLRATSKASPGSCPGTRGSPPLLLPPPAPLAPLTLTRGFTLASEPAPRPRPAAGAASAGRGGPAPPPRTWAEPRPLSQPRAPSQRGALTRAGRSQCGPSPRPPRSASVRLGLRPPARAPPPPARPVRSEGRRGARGAAGRTRQPMGSGQTPRLASSLRRSVGRRVLSPTVNQSEAPFTTLSEAYLFLELPFHGRTRSEPVPLMGTA
ncbi:basic proline-rich protein-like [Mesocricetus auratus]|uniref:Basic proline-rich protein-like n=1 Tax=Mesocricetus auratus TaxID=10036 RepID=A0ABM2YI94_MESAU|nr:basic proline-rich protein-like [Mesocricetus auratus]